MPRGARKKLKTLIGTYPHTAPLKSGAVRSDRFDLEFTEIVPVWDGFKGMIREDRYDVSEMAVVTYLIARAHEKPLALLPTVRGADAATLIVADGTSCRHQIADGTERAALHVARVLAMSLDSARPNP